MDIPMPKGVPESEAFDLAFQRLFCTSTECSHYNTECTDGNEHTFVLCPVIAERTLSMNTIKH